MLDMVIPGYVFATPFLGGQASVSRLGVYSGNDSALNAIATGTVGPIPFTNTINLEQDNWGSAIAALGTTGLARSRVLPDVPTIAEAGVPGFQFRPLREHP